ncbi:MAG: hypothetical protein JWR67_1677 [Mucilaginibacter sp.]|nr:hypothetical protein [Mucilaginibacter sp.]
MFDLIIGVFFFNLFFRNSGLCRLCGNETEGKYSYMRKALKRMASVFFGRQQMKLTQRYAQSGSRVLADFAIHR